MLVRNTVANLAGQLLYPVLALVLVPFYVRHLGLEGYGLIGLMTLVVSLLGIFSRGLGSALQREIGRRAGTPEASTLRTLLRSIEVLYWSIAVLFVLLFGTAAVLFGPGWARVQHMSSTTVAACLLLLAVRVAISFPHSVYQSVLLGTERQVLGNLLNATLALTAAIGDVLAVLAFGSVVAFYVSEGLIAAIFLFVFRHYAFHVLPSGRTSVDVGEIRQLRGVSVDLMWTNGIGLLLGNLDRVVVGALLPIRALAIYSVAVMGGRLVTLFYNPFLQAAFPRMCQIVRRGSLLQQADDVLRNAGVLVIVAAAVGIPLSAFSAEVLALWVHDPAVVREGASVMSTYVVATLFIAFASVFYQWQTAIGRTGIAVKFNTLALVWFPPLLWWMIRRAALQGAVSAWAIYGLLAWLTNLAATFGRNGLPLRSLRSYLRLLGFALAPGVLCAIIGRLAANAWFGESLKARVLCGALTGIISGAAAAAVTLNSAHWRGGSKLERAPDVRSSQEAPDRPSAPSDVSVFSRLTP